MINSGTCFRAPDELLSTWSTANGVTWAGELDGDYEAAERMLHVQPVDPERMGRNGQILREGAEALGLSHHPLARNAGDCVSCSSCPYGCRLDAKQAMHVSYLPRAVAAGARVRSGVDVRTVELEGARAVGLACRSGVASDPRGPGRPYSVRARRAIVVAGGAFGTPELLLRSGIRSQSGELGRNLRIHPACWVGARFDDDVDGWAGVMQSYAVDEWQHEGVLLEATFTPLAFGGHWLPGIGDEHQERLAAFGKIASTGVHLSDRSRGRVRLGPGGELRVGYRLLREDREKLAFGIARAAELFFAAGAARGLPADRRGEGDLPGRSRGARLVGPAARRMRLEAFHPLGTARMDADPSRGVTAIDGAVHGYERLHVADASLFPTSIGVNPMMTIVAMAGRVAKAIADA